MTGRPRKGTSVRFEPADGMASVHTGDPVLGLRFDIEARYGGTVEVDLVGERPRAIVVHLQVRSVASLSSAARSARGAPSSSIYVPTSGFSHICASTPQQRRLPICALATSRDTKPFSNGAE